LRYLSRSSPAIIHNPMRTAQEATFSDHDLYSFCQSDGSKHAEEACHHPKHNRKQVGYPRLSRRPLDSPPGTAPVEAPSVVWPWRAQRLELGSPPPAPVAASLRPSSVSVVIATCRPTLNAGIDCLPLARHQSLVLQTSQDRGTTSPLWRPALSSDLKPVVLPGLIAAA